MIKIKELAKKIQLEIKEEELSEYLATFNELEKLLINFQEIKAVKKFKPMNRIDVGYLTLSEIDKLKKNFLQRKTSKKTLQNNSKIDKNGFVLFKKTS